MSNNIKYKLDFYTEYNQFYIVDKNVGPDLESSGLWTDISVFERLGIAEGTVGVYTECYGPVKGDLELLKESRKEVDYKKYDHIVECGLNISSGFLQILDCPTSRVQLELKVPSGKYAVRVYSLNLGSVKGDEGEDFYKIEMWPEKKIMNPKVLKQYRP
ncbi:hypothetical protein BDE36_2607 [Arcticibacter tournemirensis]|uniref:Uncharacterized protein n=1 Tax=Arcticibacter tournemirensis TaxID=699437 RepID=A0A5M9GR23_9SPHI|nr:hypothetical protein [Arcticibacter tournemirensis]KAA8476147.1 hypothetical protein F1649_20375 [Arcticibacter tournemirensis]TQM50843.1 hypothetical protein BDE36_2607 [Arcticibacter tournemirensis]